MFYRFPAIFLGLVLLNTSAWASTVKINNDGSVTDLATGLIWQQQIDFGFRNHAEALIHCSGLSLAGSSTWRLPSVKELSSIVDHRISEPSVDDAIFPNTTSFFYWSATSRANSLDLAWDVDFVDGTVGISSKASKNLVRCAR